MVQLLSDLLANSLIVTEYLVKGIASIHLNWIGKCIRWLIEGIGITGVGVIVFTLILKTIVLPLDIYSRVKTKKQSLIMKKMRPQMEKLQKQYANDKNMYNQKVVELQKANGYSVFSACVPMLVSLVIFFVVFAQFSTYSQYANLESYNKMVQSYNDKIIEYVYDTSQNPDGFLIVYNEQAGEVDYTPILEVDWYGKDETGELIPSEYISFSVDFDKFVVAYRAFYETELDPLSGIDDETAKLQIVDSFVEKQAADAVEVYYTSKENKNRTHFLWVGNIWYPDSMLNKEVASFSNFKSSISKADMGDYETSYNKVTASLETQKNRYNGYFVLIVLAIGGMLLQQFISMRAQKDADELSTVNGQGARTTKYMMIIMPIIYGIFSFFYSASFSIYMITNTFYSIITSLIINKVVDIKFSKKEEEEEEKRMSRA